ncbi:MAG: DNA-processing protein DprA [Cytophagales bacterium]
MREELIYKLALSLIPGIGGYTFKLLISYCGSAKEVFQAHPARILRIPGIGAHTHALIKNNASLKEAQRVFDYCEKQKIKILFHSDPEYPKRIKNIPDAPSVLYFKGNCDLNSEKAVSIVGTRNASKYGIEVCKEIVGKLKKHNTLIISGLAYGIDITAHKESINQKLTTVGVLAGGIDKIYPASHKVFAEKMIQNGGLLTEHPPGTVPDAPKFPARNRIIAAFCDAVIVVEAAKKGGALITADLANGYNKDVFAVPGNIYNTYSEGCNNIIKQHKANIFTNITDLEYYLNWDQETESVKKTEIDLEELQKDEKSVIIELKKNNSIIIDQLAWNTQIPVNKLASILLNLEFRGLINSLPGKKYSLSEVYK